MRNKILYTVLFSLLMLFLFSSVVQKECDIFDMKPLEGVTIATEKPDFNIKNVSSTEYQKNIEQYISENFGFREAVIRLYNQYVWAFYNKTYCKNVLIGKDRWLFNEKSVKDYYEGLLSEYASSEDELLRKFDNDVKRLKKLQALLKEQGTDIFVLMLPSKDLIYPEFLPKNTEYQENNSIRAVDYYSEAFAENGINFLNIIDYFKMIKDDVDYPIFPKAGMHWSNIACAHASDTIIRYMEHLSGENFLNIKIGETYPDITKSPDNDMEKLLNLSLPISNNQNYYADISVTPDTSARKPKIAIMGDSFFWNMAYTLPMDEIFESYHYWYYFNTIYYDPEHDNVGELDLVKELKETDVVMISLSATQLYDINHDFISQALIKLSLDDQEMIDNILSTIKDKIKNDQNWYNSIVEKASQKGISVEEALNQDAMYILNLEPEKYISF